MDFFAEFERLKDKTPRLGSVVINAINSQYTHNTDQCKNCYLLCNAVKNEDCMYGRDFYENTDSVDCDHILRCTLCYDCVNCKDCWNCTGLQDCKSCQDCSFGYDLQDCKNCIGCVGLRKKEFHIFNQPYSKEDFLKRKAALSPGEVQREFEALKLKVPRRETIQINTENCYGDSIHNSKNIFYGFDVVDSQDCSYISEGQKLKDCCDIFVLEYSELCYDISSSYRLNNCNFCFSCVSSSNLEYCEWIMNSHDCFGCVSRNHAEYEILNQKYAKEEYFKRVKEIKDQLKREGKYGGIYLTPTYPLEDTVATWNRL